jgi:hypothetical protein
VIFGVSELDPPFWIDQGWRGHLPGGNSLGGLIQISRLSGSSQDLAGIESH